MIGNGIGRAALSAAVAAALAAPAAAATRAAEITPEQVRRVLRPHALETRDGRRFTLESLRGEVVVVSFWASWCAPCRRELPRLDALHAELSRRGGRVVAISIDREASSADRFVRRHRLSLPVVHDGPDGLARSLDLGRIPTTVVLDREGDLAFTLDGADPAALASLETFARRLAGGAAPTAAGEAR